MSTCERTPAADLGEQSLPTQHTRPIAQGQHNHTPLASFTQGPQSTLQTAINSTHYLSSISFILNFQMGKLRHRAEVRLSHWYLQGWGVKPEVLPWAGHCPHFTRMELVGWSLSLHHSWSRGTSGSTRDPTSAQGSELSDAWLSPAQKQPQLLCSEGNSAPLAGEETGVLVLSPELELVLQRGRSNGRSASHSSSLHHCPNTFSS